MTQPFESAKIGPLRMGINHRFSTYWNFLKYHVVNDIVWKKTYYKVMPLCQIEDFEEIELCDRPTGKVDTTYTCKNTFVKDYFGRFIYEYDIVAYAESGKVIVENGMYTGQCGIAIGYDNGVAVNIVGSNVLPVVTDDYTNQILIIGNIYEDGFNIASIYTKTYKYSLKEAVEKFGY